MTKTASVTVANVSGPVAASIATQGDYVSLPSRGTQTYVVWSSENATAVSVTGPNLGTQNALSGKVGITGLSYGNYIYTITAQGNGGPVIKRANVVVVGGSGRNTSMNAIPSYYPNGDTVAWTGGPVEFWGDSNMNGPGYINIYRNESDGSRTWMGSIDINTPAGTNQYWGTWEAPPTTSTTRVSYFAEERGSDQYGGYCTASFVQAAAPTAVPQTVSISPASASVAPGATVTFAASGGQTGYVWNGISTSNGATATFKVPTTASAGDSFSVTVYSRAGVSGGTNWAQSNTATATVTVAIARSVTRFTPVASSYTVKDPNSPMNGQTYGRIWQENGGWTAYLGRSGVRFEVQGQASPSVRAVEIQSKTPGGEWSLLARQDLAEPVGTADLILSVTLGGTVPGEPLVPLSFQQGAPDIGPWLFRARIEDDGGVWSDFSSEVPVNVVLPVVTKTLSGQTVPPAGDLGNWFTASPVKNFSMQLWIP